MRRSPGSKAACESILEGLSEANTGLIVPSLEDLGAILSTIAGADHLREEVHAASDALPSFGDTPPSVADLAQSAPHLIALSNGLIAAGVEASCAGIGELAANYTEVEVDSDLVSRALHDARATWSSQGISTYAVELSLGPMDTFAEVCGTGGSLLVQVIEGRVVRAVDRFSRCDVEVDDPDRVPLTVEELFALVEANLDAGTIEVDFDPQLGYPRSIFIRDGVGFTDVSVMSFTRGEAELNAAEEILAELAAQREVWADGGIANYTMTVGVGCFCPEEFRGPFEVTVEDGDLETVTINGEVVQPLDEAFLTVEDLFDTIESYAYSDEISVTYAAEGYPLVIDVDPSRNTVDEELRIDVGDLTPSAS